MTRQPVSELHRWVKEWRLEVLDEQPQRDAQQEVRRDRLHPDVLPLFEAEPAKPKCRIDDDVGHDPTQDRVDYKRQKRVRGICHKEPALFDKHDVDEAKQESDHDVNEKPDQKDLVLVTNLETEDRLHVDEQGRFLDSTFFRDFEQDRGNRKRKRDQTSERAAKQIVHR